MLAHGISGKHAEPQDNVTQWLASACTQMLSHQSVVASHHLSLNHDSIMQLLRLLHASQQNGVVLGGSSDGINPHAEGILTAFKQIPWSMLVRDQEEVSDAVKYFRQSAVEPRAAEWLALSNSVVPVELLAADIFHKKSHERDGGQADEGAA